MKSRMRYGAGLLALTLLAAGCAGGGETLVSENFDTMKLEELPPGWSKSEPALLSLVEENGHGNVLKISNKDERYAALIFTIDPAKAAGKIVRASVSAKFPAAYVPIADKLWASPKVSFDLKDAAGVKITSNGDLVPQAGKPDWQELKKEFTIPANAASISVQLCVQFVTAEVLFDNLAIEVLSAAPATAPAPAANVAKPVTPAATQTPAQPPKAPPASADPSSAAGRAASAPKKELSDDGMIFSPDHAARMQRIAESKKAAPNTLMIVGTGVSDKDAAPKLPANWKMLPAPKLTGSAGAPRYLLATLPDVLVKEKPEVVLIEGDSAPGRKPTKTEAEDWEDVAKLCARFGAVPVIVLQPAGAKDENLESINSSLKKALDINNFIALSAQPQDVYLRRISSLVSLLDTHVFLRGKIEEKKGAAGSGAGTAKPIDE